ncbi:IPTL-CTERM sorting domain-containing protein [Allofranklinella schreckenbergeri]|uniref:IPTL-CTERM sorting domain-containing protein n=1 Tax=Allofranklinella schreckenbergeri TaxID=1076744 RepID=UPI001EEE8DB0|nr:IPTL-CTERM sorting domain-containing protein [Allofranklinella schreckenbergeri]
MHSALWRIRPCCTRRHSCLHSSPPPPRFERLRRWRRASLRGLALALGAASAAQAAIPQTERDALIALYNSTNGAHWKYRNNWRNSGDTDFNAPGTECSWYGVTCDGAQAHVIKVDLENNRLSGEIPDLSGLPQLGDFEAGANQLSGPIPKLSGLQQLQTFDVSQNQLSGEIPKLSGLPKLENFNVYTNQLSGPIPDLSGLPQLQHFNVHTNQLSGPIPDLSGLSQLQVFRAYNNLLTGKPPAAPTSLLANKSRLCPNLLEAPSPTDTAWDTATGGNWHSGCSATAHTVTAQAGPNGSVSPATQQRVHGTAAVLRFTPAAGYALDQATAVPSCGPGAIIRYDPYLEIKSVEADCDIQVSFKLLPGHHAITATANPSAGGTVSCTPGTVPDGGSSSCTATANSGYVFDAFNGGDCTSVSGNTCQLTNVTAPKTVTANFRLISAPPSSGVTPVPTLGHWALMLLGLLTAALGLQRLRRS